MTITDLAFGSSVTGSNLLSGLFFRYCKFSGQPVSSHLLNRSKCSESNGAAVVMPTRSKPISRALCFILFVKFISIQESQNGRYYNISAKVSL